MHGYGIYLWYPKGSPDIGAGAAETAGEAGTATEAGAASEAQAAGAAEATKVGWAWGWEYDTDDEGRVGRTGDRRAVPGSF